MTAIALTVLGSGSKGNSTLLEIGGDKVLLDAGFSIRQLRRRLEAVGCRPDEIDAVCCTHTHSDHIREISLRMILQHNIKLFIHAENEQVFCSRFARFRHVRTAGLSRTFREAPFSIRGIRINPLRFPHDSEGVNTGFQVFAPNEDGGEFKISYVTDLGFFPEEHFEQFRDSDIVVIEANHDPGMLRESARPEVLKKRILSSRGHLSNGQALTALRGILGRAENCATRHVILAHLSEECNTPELVRRDVISQLRSDGYRDMEIHIADQHEPGERIELGRESTAGV